MTEQYRAHHSEWTYVRRQAELGHSDPSCILELLSRVEALESAKPAESNDPAEPNGSLVERVADAIYRNGTGDGFREEARAAILSVADWIKQQGSHTWAMRLRQEVE